jgi:hypothetical protein
VKSLNAWTKASCETIHRDEKSLGVPTIYGKKEYDANMARAAKTFKRKKEKHVQ